MPRTTQPRKTWPYTKDFKVKAVEMSLQAGIQVKQVAEGLDIHPIMLSRRRKEYRDGKLHGDDKKRLGVYRNKPMSAHTTGNGWYSTGTIPQIRVSCMCWPSIARKSHRLSC